MKHMGFLEPTEDEDDFISQDVKDFFVREDAEEAFCDGRLPEDANPFEKNSKDWKNWNQAYEECLDIGLIFGQKDY